MKTLPIFDIPFVLLPGEITVFNIFEPVYKELFSDCLETESSLFGMLFRGQRLGTVAEVQQVLEERVDGSSAILCRGLRRFQVVRSIEIKNYPVAEVIELNDESNLALSPEPSKLEHYFELLSNTLDREIDSNSKITDNDNSFTLASLLALDNLEKFKLLESDNELERLELIENFSKFKLHQMEMPGSSSLPVDGGREYH